MIKEESVLDTTFDCILGLAYPTMANSASHLGKPLFDTMIEQKVLNKNVFAFFMSLCEEEKSELTFGWYDDSKIKGNIQWHDVIYQFFWALELNDVKV